MTPGIAFASSVSMHDTGTQAYFTYSAGSSIVGQPYFRAEFCDNPTCSGVVYLDTGVTAVTGSGTDTWTYRMENLANPTMLPLLSGSSYASLRSTATTSYAVVTACSARASGFPFDCTGTQSVVSVVSFISDGTGTYHAFRLGDDYMSGVSRIVTVTNPALFSTTTSPVSFNFDYEIADDSTGHASSQYWFTITRTSDNSYSTLVGNLPSTSIGIHSATTSSVTLPLGGTYTVNAYLSDGVRITSRNQLPDVTTFFGIDFNDSLQNVHISGIDRTLYASSSCAISFAGTFHLSDCIGYLVSPSTGSTSPLSQLQSVSLAHAFPFAYMYQLGDIRQALFNATNTASSSLSVSIPWFGGTTHEFTFISVAMLEAVPYASTIKTILAMLLWLMLAEFVYYKVIRVHDVTTPP